MEHIKMIALMTTVVVASFLGMAVIVITPFWMAASAGML